MDKTKKKIRNIGLTFYIILTIIIIIGIIVSSVTLLCGLVIGILPQEALPDVMSQSIFEFISTNDLEETGLDELEEAFETEDPETYIQAAVSTMIDSFGGTGIVNFVNLMNNNSGQPLTLKFISCVLLLSVAFAAGGIVIYMFVIRSIVKTISSGKQPFTKKAAKKLRILSFITLLFIIAEPLASILLFAVTFIFSYLFDYGAYLQEKADETNRIQEEMIMSFAEVTENKSEQTGKHVRRVAEYSKILAEEMGLSEEQTENIHLASTMHDIGKLMIPSEILEKPARLTDEEFAVIKQHSSYGGKLLSNVEGNVMQLAKTIALDHHERIDGRGYPDGKSSEEISIEGRIVAVADVYDALTSKRSYKEAWDDDRAYNEIVKGSGTQFDENVVEAFKRSYEKINEMRMKYADAV